MRQPKPFRTIDQQLDILESRGVIIENREEAGRFLLSENYYSVINGYKEALLDKSKSNKSLEVYREGTLFEEFQLQRTNRMCRLLLEEPRVRPPLGYGSRDNFWHHILIL